MPAETLPPSTASDPFAPLPFSPSMEVIADDEAETVDGLNEALLKISHVVLEDTGHALRSVHAKSHGILRGELQVLPNLPPEFTQGVFQPGRRYATVLRFSTPPGDVLPDDVSTPRGVAIKLMGVDGERLPGSEGDNTQDFIMIDAPAFGAPDAQHFLRALKLLAATTDRAEGGKQVFSAILRGTERALESIGIESGTIKSMGGHPMTNLLGETFHTGVPVLFGRYIAKLSLVPSSAALQALTNAVLDLKAHPNGLRDAVKAFFAGQGGEWTVRAQLCTDLEKMPIEDASVPWPESASPHVPVATLVVPMQNSWDDLVSPGIDDRLSFSPWHGVAAHRPLGSVMRARRRAYETSAEFRGQHNGCPMHQPRTTDEALRGE